MDKDFFSEQVLACERSLYRIAISYMKQDSDAADATQQAILIAWDKRHTLRQQEYFKTWLIRILINVCKQALKKGRKEEPSEMEEAAVDAEDSELRLDIQNALYQLAEKERIVIILFYLDGFSIQEIAGMLRLPQGTIKSRLHRAKKHLKKILGEEIVNHA